MARSSVHARLDALRQKAATERAGWRDAAARLEAGRAKVERAAAAVTAAYAEDDAAPGPAREELEAAEAEVIDLGHRAAAAELRAASA